MPISYVSRANRDRARVRPRLETCRRLSAARDFYIHAPESIEIRRDPEAAASGLGWNQCPSSSHDKLIRAVVEREPCQCPFGRTGERGDRKDRYAARDRIVLNDAAPVGGEPQGETWSDRRIAAEVDGEAATLRPRFGAAADREDCRQDDGGERREKHSSLHDGCSGLVYRCGTVCPDDSIQVEPPGFIIGHATPRLSDIRPSPDLRQPRPRYNVTDTTR